MSGLYCVFAKWPVPGRVKTRLARVVGDQNAAEAAMAFLEDTLRNLARDEVEIVLALDDLTKSLELPVPVLVWPQGEGDLGERMTRVLTRALERHDWVVAFGADAPTIPVDRRTRSVEALSRADGPDAVIGPADDGGYYLLGTKRLPVGSLTGVRWGTSSACFDTITGLRGTGLSVLELDPWYDVDGVEDLERLVGELEARPELAPRTWDTMKRLAWTRSAGIVGSVGVASPQVRIQGREPER